MRLKRIEKTFAFLILSTTVTLIMIYNFQQISFPDSYLFRESKGYVGYKEQPDEGVSLTYNKILDSVEDLMSAVDKNLKKDLRQKQDLQQEFTVSFQKDLQSTLPSPKLNQESHLHISSYDSLKPQNNTFYDAILASLKNGNLQRQSDLQTLLENDLQTPNSNFDAEPNLEINKSNIELRSNKPITKLDSLMGFNSNSKLKQIFEVKPPKATNSQCLVIPQHKLPVKEIPQEGKYIEEKNEFIV